MLNQKLLLNAVTEFILSLGLDVPYYKMKGYYHAIVLTLEYTDGEVEYEFVVRANDSIEVKKVN